MALIRTIPLVRIGVFDAFIDLAYKIGVPVEKTLRSVGLPTELSDCPDTLLPELPAWRFVQSVSLIEGISNFGLLAVDTSPHQDIPTLAPLLQGCTNLYDLLKRFCITAPLQSSTAQYSLEHSEDVIWFKQKGNRLLNDDVQIQMFKLLGMIQLVQLATGRNWRPAEIHFTFKYRIETESAPELNPSRILFSQHEPAIAIPRKLLPLPLPSLAASSKHDSVAGPDLQTIPESLSDALRTAITPYIGTEQLNNKLLSEAIGMSPRTLQRRLSEQNLSYSQILEQARTKKAEVLLKETDIKLLDISILLGYENASSFTRAFSRWTGVSPKEYRKLSLS